MSGQLLTHYFLTDGIKATDEWKSSVSDPEAFGAFRDRVRQRYDALSRSADPNEAVTEQELIRPVLELLGWADYLPQQGTARKEDIPDHLLFADADSKQRAAAEHNVGDRFRYAAVVEESKRFGLSLNDRDKDDKVQARTPHGQILRYLSTADIESESRIRWGILTNGRVWRLYDYRARPRVSGYFEADLATLLKPGKEDDLRVFHLLFHRMPSRFGTVQRSPSWKPRWPRGGAMRKRLRRIFRRWCSSVFSRILSRLLRKPRRHASRRSTRQR